MLINLVFNNMGNLLTQNLKLKTQNYNSKLKTFKFLPALLIFYFCLLTFYGVRTYLRNLDWRDEIKLWEAAKEIYPQSPVIYYNLANMYSDAEKYETAISDYRQVIHLLPSFYNAYFNLAAVYKKAGDEKSAEELYESIIDLDPTLLEAHLGLADLYLRRGENDLALSVLTGALKYEEKYLESRDEHKAAVVSSIYGNIGVLYEENKDKKKSGEYFKRALEINPRNEYAKRGLYEIVGEPNFQSITPPTRNGVINNYKSKAGYSFDYPGSWKVIETKEKVRLESGGLAIEIYAVENPEGLSFEEYIAASIAAEPVLKYGFVALPNTDRAYARLFRAGDAAKSEFLISKGGRVFRILIDPTADAAEGAFDKIAETIK